MLIFVLGIIVAFNLSSCRQEHDKPDLSQSISQQPAASLYFPTETDTIKLRSFVVSRRLTAVTNQADQYGAAFHTKAAYASEGERSLDQEFLKAFLGGQYERIDEFMSRFSSMIPVDPAVKPSGLVASKIGFTQVWKFAERFRALSPGEAFNEAKAKELFDSAGACAEFFTLATEVDPGDSILKGFAAACNLLVGQSPQSELSLLKGLTYASQAIRRNPEFNLFTIGYIMSSLPIDRPEFGLGLEMMWRNLDLCFDTKIDRERPNISRFLKDFAPIGQKRFCINSEASPHNFEGFMMIFGDLLVKAGKPQVAREMYNNAQLLPSFLTWPHKDRLFERIKMADTNVAPFQASINPMVKPSSPTITFNTEYSCMVCHQNK